MLAARRAVVQSVRLAYRDKSERNCNEEGRARGHSRARNDSGGDDYFAFSDELSPSRLRFFRAGSTVLGVTAVACISSQTSRAERVRLLQYALRGLR